ncbi:MAG: PTS sugar transporter subunit IIA [Deltaproteobacteria bacterium]|nr:PTS sugar transporter subunit IIA [Deltaproteobacteria bacterium]
MRISDILQVDAIEADLKAKGKQDVLTELVDTLMRVETGLDRDEVVKVLLEREKLGSTGIGDGIAIPHGKLKGLQELIISFGRSQNGVEFDSMDGKPVNLFFLLIAPEESIGIHLKTLARISKLLKNSMVRQKLCEASTAEDVFSIISEEEGKL